MPVASNAMNMVILPFRFEEKRQWRFIFSTFLGRMLSDSRFDGMSEKFRFFNTFGENIKSSKIETCYGCLEKWRTYDVKKKVWPQNRCLWISNIDTVADVLVAFSEIKSAQHLGAGSKDGLPARLHVDVTHVTNLCARTRVSNIPLLAGYNKFVRGSKFDFLNGA